jgi:hypothetical protein
MPHDGATCNDQRRSPRLHPKGGTQLEVFREPDGTGPDIAVKVVDLSATGAKLVLSERLPPGHVIGIAMYGPGPLPIAGVAEVVWSKEEDGAYPTGIEFRRPAGGEQLASLAQR